MTGHNPAETELPSVRDLNGAPAGWAISCCIPPCPGDILLVAGRPLRCAGLEIKRELHAGALSQPSRACFAHDLSGLL